MTETLSRSSSMVDDEEVFEITDFTTVSDWEKFIAQITEAVSDWQLTCTDSYRPLRREELTSGKWEQLSREISLCYFKYAEQNVTSSDKFGQVSCCEFHKCLSKALQRRSLIVYDKEWRAVMYPYSSPTRFSNAIFMLTLYRLTQSSDEDEYFEESDNSTEDVVHFPTCLSDMMSMDNDFPPRAHCLVRWYGFRSFVTLSLIASGTIGGAGLISESKCNLLLSSACIVLSESGCEVPLFIQIQQNWRKMFTGRCVGTGMQCEFEMVHMKKCPPQYRHLSGLLHVFKSKIGRIQSSIVVSARFTYILSDWGSKGAWPEEQVDPDVAAQTLDRLLFGCLEDPVSDLHLSAVWPSVYDNMIAENDIHSDFNPLIAPVWAIKISYTDNPECLLSSYLRDFLKLISATDTFSGLITTTAQNDSEQDMGQALSKLTDSSHKVKQMVPLMPRLTSGISKIVETGKSVRASRLKYSSRVTTGPVSQPMLELIMEFLFQESDTTAESKEDFSHKLEHQLKSAPPDSLTYRLALCLCVMNYCHGGLPAIAQVWHEFVQELRYRFENGILLDGIELENPDLRCCLLHQKLQMLNCCVQHKNARERKQSLSFDDDSSQSETSKSAERKDSYELETAEILGSEKTNVNNKRGDLASVDIEDIEGAPVKSDDLAEKLGNVAKESEKGVNESMVSVETSVRSKDSSSSFKSSAWQDEVSSVEDEFFDCDEGDQSDLSLRDEDDETAPSNGIFEKGGESKQELRNGSTTSNCLDIPTNHNAKAEGRLEPFENANLLHYEVPLYIPVTQEPAPVTEDILEEQTQIFSSLGDSVEGASLRRKMQSASLLSDMESFKCANPGCVLADFVRWYSPRDYELSTGQLSDRMKLPGNLWLTMWGNAKAVPARRQKRLFDDTKEGEKVLHYLSSLRPNELVTNLMPVCYHEAIGILDHESENGLPSLATLRSQILSQSCKVFQSNNPTENQSRLEDILQKIQFTETLIARIKSLKHKFKNVSNIDGFVQSVIENPEVVLKDAASGELGNVIKQYFLDQAMAQAAPVYSTESESLVKTPSFPAARGREYILRTTAVKPSVQSRTLPHRMYAVLINGEFRLAGAFSSDTVFF